MAVGGTRWGTVWGRFRASAATVDGCAGLNLNWCGWLSQAMYGSVWMAVQGSIRTCAPPEEHSVPLRVTEQRRGSEQGADSRASCLGNNSIPGQKCRFPPHTSLLSGSELPFSGSALLRAKSELEPEEAAPLCWMRLLK